MQRAHSFLLLSRASQSSADGGRKHGLEGDTALAAALRHYLPYLQALSQATAPDMLPRTKHDRPPAQVTAAAVSKLRVCPSLPCVDLSGCTPGISVNLHFSWFASRLRLVGIRAGVGKCPGPLLESHTPAQVQQQLPSHAQH